MLIAVIVPVTSFAQNMGDGPDKLWLSACTVGMGTECNQSQLFHNAISAPFSQSDSVAIGTIIQKESTGENSISYSIDVDFYLKNYQPFDLLTVTLDDAPELQKFPDVLYYNSSVFNEGDLVFVYLIKNDGHYELLPESFALDKQEGRGPPPTILLTKSPAEDVFLQGEKIIVSGEIRKMELVKAAKNGEKLDVKLTLHKPYDENTVFFSDLMDADADGSYKYSLDTSNISPGDYALEVNYGPSSTDTEITINFNSIYWSPLKQFKSGISLDEIQCKDGLVEVIKISNNSPACVSLETKAKLIQRGWAIDPVFYGLTKSQITDIQQAKFGCKKLGNQTYCDTMVQEKIEHYLQQNKLGTQLEPEPSPEPKPETIDEQDMRKDKARMKIQEIIMTDYRGNQHQMDAINEYRNEFELGHFLEQYIHTFDQNYEKDELVNFALVEWGYQETDCTYPKVELYFMPYETKAIEKIGEWEKPNDNCFSIDSDENGYVIADVWHVPGIFEPHEICTIPGEYRISVTNLKDTPDIEWGYFTCQKDMLVGNPEPWMDLSG